MFYRSKYDWLLNHCIVYQQLMKLAYQHDVTVAPPLCLLCLTFSSKSQSNYTCIIFTLHPKFWTVLMGPMRDVKVLVWSLLGENAFWKPTRTDKVRLHPPNDNDGSAETTDFSVIICFENNVSPTVECSRMSSGDLFKHPAIYCPLHFPTSCNSATWSCGRVPQAFWETTSGIPLRWVPSTDCKWKGWHGAKGVPRSLQTLKANLHIQPSQKASLINHLQTLFRTWTHHLTCGLPWFTNISVLRDIPFAEASDICLDPNEIPKLLSTSANQFVNQTHLTKNWSQVVLEMIRQKKNWKWIDIDPVEMGTS